MKLLLILPGAIGDFILTSPAAVWLRQKLRPRYVEIWVERASLPLATSCSQADRALVLADTGVERWPTPEIVISRLKQFDRVISWYGIGYSEWTEQIRHQVHQIDFLPSFQHCTEIHAMDFRRRQVESLLGADESFPAFPQIEISEEALAFSREYLATELCCNRPIIVIHPGASGVRKRWAANCFTRLITSLIEATNQVLVCEGPLDLEVVNEVMAQACVSESKTQPRRIRIDDLMELAAVIRHSQLYVGNDSGIGHLAAASGIPTLSIFTATDPAIWSPRGPRARFLRSPKVDDVLGETRCMGLA